MSVSLIDENDALSRRLAYLAAILLVLVPLLQAGQQLWPIQLGNIRWRYGAASALSGVLLLPFLGLTLAALLARRSDESPVLRVVAGVTSAVFAAGLLLCLALFVLDALELRTVINAPMMAAFQATTARVALVTLVFAVGFTFLSYAALARPRRATRSRRGANRSPEVVGLIVGQESAPPE
jgi:cytochrome bd-type quinol oxidase subunit 2